MSMTAPAPLSGAMTFQEFIAAADEHLRSEWVNGQMVWLASEPRVHWQISSFVACAISGFVSRTGLGGDAIYGAVPMRLGSNAREPDVMYLRPENAHRWQEYHVEGPADLVVEVIGADSEARDRIEKLAEYQAAGVPEYWLIDPMRRTADLYCLSVDGAYALVPPDEQSRLWSQVIPGFWIYPEWLWAEKPSEWVAFEQWGLV